MRVIICTDDVMRIEKGYPPQDYQIPWNAVREINVYRVEMTESKTVIKELNPGEKFVKNLAQNTFRHATGGFGALIIGNKEPQTEKIQTFKEAFVCEIVTDQGKHLIIGDKFNYGKTLGPDMEYNITNNFTKLVKKLVRYCQEVNMNRGTQIIMSKNC
jgi:hypothetical protein